MQLPENAMFHRHLLLAYSFTWVLQLGYLSFVVRRHLAARAARTKATHAAGPH